MHTNLALPSSEYWGAPLSLRPFQQPSLEEAAGLQAVPFP